jgi:hypothetical protein
MAVLDTRGFIALIKSLTGIQNVVFSHDPTPQIGDIDRAQIVLTYKSVVARHVDEHRPVWSDPAYPVGTSYVLEIGNRDVIVSVRAEVYDGGAEAIELIEAIRIGIRSAASTESLNEMMLAFQWMSPAVDRQFKAETREVCAAVADIRLSGISMVKTGIILPGQGGDYIAEILPNNTITGTFTP